MDSSSSSSLRRSGRLSGKHRRNYLHPIKINEQHSHKIKKPRRHPPPRAPPPSPPQQPPQAAAPPPSPPQQPPQAAAPLSRSCLLSQVQIYQAPPKIIQTIKHITSNIPLQGHDIKKRHRQSYFSSSSQASTTTPLQLLSSNLGSFSDLLRDFASLLNDQSLVTDQHEDKMDNDQDHHYRLPPGSSFFKGLTPAVRDSCPGILYAGPTSYVIFSSPPILALSSNNHAGYFQDLNPVFFVNKKKNCVESNFIPRLYTDFSNPSGYIHKKMMQRVVKTTSGGRKDLMMMRKKPSSSVSASDDDDQYCSIDEFLDEIKYQEFWDY